MSGKWNYQDNERINFHIASCQDKPVVHLADEYRSVVDVFEHRGRESRPGSEASRSQMQKSQSIMGSTAGVSVQIESTDYMSADCFMM